MTMHMGDKRPECCRQEANLEVTEVKAVPDGTLTTRTCRECGRRHFEMRGKPKRVGIAAR
jgi:hypothetical protein